MVVVANVDVCKGLLMCKIIAAFHIAVVVALTKSTKRIFPANKNILGRYVKLLLLVYAIVGRYIGRLDLGRYFH